MNKRYTALISTISNSFCDFSLDFAINKYNMYKVLAVTTFLAMIGQLIIGLIVGIKITLISIPFVLLYGVVIFGGYITYVKSLKTIPIGLAGLIESGSLFIILAIDIFVGYLKPTPHFLILFLLFIISIIIFSMETNKINEEIKRFSFRRFGSTLLSIITFKYKREGSTIKKITFKGICFLLLSMLLYCLEPYLIKISNLKGANEIAINLGYYIFGTTYFLISYIKSKNNKIDSIKKDIINKKFLLICIAIASLETIYYLFGTISYINDTPIIVCIIEEVRVFLLVLLSVIFGTDKMTPKKVIATIIAMIAVAGLYFS